MSQILTISRLTFLLALRNGVIPTLKILVAGTAVFIFFSSAGDGELIHELELRLQYSFALAYALLTMLIMAVSCFMVRTQINGRQMHMLTSRPVPRSAIWLGKWLGLTAVAVVGEITLIFTLALCCFFYARTFPADAVSQAKTFFGMTRRECRPVQPSLKELTRKQIDRLARDGKLDPNKIDRAAWKKQFDQVRRQQQRVDPKKGRVWQFSLSARPKYGETAQLAYRLYAANRWSVIKGEWEISSPDSSQVFRQPFAIHPYARATIDFPVSVIPETGRVTVTLRLKSTAEVLVDYHSGLFLYYRARPLSVNLLLVVLLQIFHLAIAAAAGLTAGVAFTFSVAAFFTMALYFLSMSAGFFSEVIQDLTHSYQISLLNHLATLMIQAGMWLARGLQPPPVVVDFGSAITIPLSHLALNWFPGTLVYGLVTIFLGIWLLTRKELDKIPT